MPIYNETQEGLDQLLQLNNFIDIYYNPEDQSSSSISNLHYILDTSGILGTESQSASEFFKYLKALSYAFYDVDKIVEDIAELVDINNCPTEFLEYLANMIGWTFVGGDIDSWRSQLRQAVYIYKTKGTKQSLIDALGYVFPQPLTTFSPASSIKECYESYVPFLIYYVLKTESPICQDSTQLIEFLKEGQRNTDIVYNIDSYDQDKNIRFCVDAILEEIDRELKFITINGVHYKETEVFKNQPDQDVGWIKNGQRVTGKGYQHRNGFTLAIPPWENERFYQTTFITSEFLDHLRLILGGCGNGQRYGVSDSVLNSLVAYIKNRTGIENENDPFYFGYNNTFKFFTSSLEIPFNKPQVTLSGNDSQLAALDYWNSRSSHIFVVLDVSSFDPTIFSANAITSSTISNISYTLGEFLPFHALPRIVIKIAITDDYYGYVESVFYSLVRTLEESNTNLLASYEVSGWLGTSGIGDFYSSVDTTYAKQFGRFLPKPTNAFWTVNAGGVPRKATRRRNWRYEVDGEGYSMNGKNNPLPLYFYGSSLSALERSPEYIPLGFNFSGQHFVGTDSVRLKSVYDTSNAPIILNGSIVANSPSAIVMGLPVSSTILMLGIEDLIDNFTVYSHRLLLPQKFYKMIVDYLIRIGAADKSKLQFDITRIENVEFGDLNELWIDYRSVFNNQLDGSGFYALNHAYGPLIYNGTFELSGTAGNSNTSSYAAYRDGRGILLDSSEYSYIFGSDGINDGYSFRTQDNQLNSPSRDGLVWSKGWNSYRHELDLFERKNLFTQRSQLANIEIVAKDKSTAVIVADFSGVIATGCEQERDQDVKGIVFYGGHDDLPIEEQIKIRIPLIRNKNLIPNGRLVNPQSNPDLMFDYSTSSLNDWVLRNNASIITMSGVSAIASWDVPNEFNAFSFSGSNVSFSSLNSQSARSSLIKNIIPSHTYQIEYEASSLNASSFASVGFYNHANKKYYNFYNNQWSNTPIGSFIGSGLGSTGWLKYTLSSITIDPSFSIEDTYSVMFGVSVSGLDGNKTLIRYPFLRQVEENTLLPNREYEMIINLDSSSFNDITQGGLNKFQVRILTGERKYQGKDSISDRFAFDFKRNRWMVLTSNTLNKYNKIYTVADGATSLKLNFHTLNQYGPLDEQTRNLKTEPQYLNVHTTDTYYYIELTPIFDKRNMPTDLYRPSIRLEQVWLRDLKYEEVYQNYTRKESKLILDELTDMKNSYHTRDSVIAESLDLSTSGGSRNIYLEYFGGKVVNSNSGGITTYNL